MPRCGRRWGLARVLGFAQVGGFFAVQFGIVVVGIHIYTFSGVASFHTDGGTQLRWSSCLLDIFSCSVPSYTRLCSRGKPEMGHLLADHVSFLLWHCCARVPHAHSDFRQVHGSIVLAATPHHHSTSSLCEGLSCLRSTVALVWGIGFEYPPARLA